MSQPLRLTIAFEEPDSEGWIVASVIEVPGALSQWRSRDDSKATVVPRHPEIGPGLVRAICRQLEIPVP